MNYNETCVKLYREARETIKGHEKWAGWLLICINDTIKSNDRCWWALPGENIPSPMDMWEVQAASNPPVVCLTPEEASKKNGGRFVLLVCRKRNGEHTERHVAPTKAEEPEGDRLMKFFFGS